jgi:flagellin
MSNDVVLSAALRNNLLSLKSTQSQIDVHQNRLATGKKVNSALDNPQSFFAAQALTNRANDLSNLLDSIGQSIQVIQAANNGVTALTTLVSQAQSLANTALSTLAGASTQATVTGTADLGGPAVPKKLNTISGIATNDTIIFNITDPASTTGALSLTNGTVTIGANDTSADLVTKINDLNTALSSPVIQASLDSSNHLVLTAINGGSLNVKFVTNGAATQATNLASSQAFGFGAIAQFNQQGNVATTGTVDFTATANGALTSKGLYTAVGVLAQGATLLTALRDSANTALTTGLAAADTLTIKVGGKTTVTDLFHVNGKTAATATVQDIVDGINNDANIKSLISASFDSTTGKISITAKDASATDIQVTLNSAAGNTNFNIGFGFLAFATGAGANAKASEVIRFGAAAGTLASLQTQYNTTLSQINSLVTDTGYAGTNLLNGNNLTTYFNESRTSSLVTTSATFTSSNLGLTSASFQSSSAISSSVTQTQNALTTLRNFGSTLSTNLSIIQARQSFTSNLINTLETGSDALTNADQNEEGASLLALQTRQSLGITSLSLASQAQQAILRLF